MNVADINSIEFGNQFAKAIKDVLSATCKLSLTAETANEEAEKGYPSFVTGMMVFQGTKDVVLTLTFSKNAAADVVVNFLGAKYDQIVDVEVYDAIMEMTNMVAGKLKTAIVANGDRYQLTTPFVFVGQNHFLAAKTRPISLVKKFKDKQFEMLAGVFFL